MSPLTDTSETRSGRGPAAYAATLYELLARLPSARWFAYGAVLLVQARGLWGIWRKDFDGGDTTSYFGYAQLWTDDLTVNIAWSPAYTAFLGTLNWLMEPIEAELVHRVLIAFAAAVLVLALLRRLLPPWAALIGACWWAALPIVYATKYSVHLFAVLPLLIAALLLTNDPGGRRKGAALAVLVTSAVIVRNEAIVMAAVLAVALLIGELRSRSAGRTIPLRRLALSFGLPLLAALVVVGVAYQRSNAAERTTEAPEARVATDAEQAFSSKQSLVVCQAYRFNLIQRDPSRAFGRTCDDLMTEVFGDPAPSLVDAWTSNPGAMIDFAAWNVRLLPAGLQLSLFNAAAGSENPGYEPATLGRTRSAFLGLLILGLLVAGGVTLRRDWDHWKRMLYRQRWAWIGLGAIAVGVLAVVLLSQRPRPAYMFGLTAGLLAAIWLSVSVLARRFGLYKPAAALAAVVPAALVLALPTQFFGWTPIRDTVARVGPAIERPGAAESPVIAARGWSADACSLLLPNRPCRGINVGPNPEARAAVGGLRNLLDARGVTVVYADEFGIQLDSELSGFVERPGPGWEVFESGSNSRGRWVVLTRDPAAAMEAAAEEAAQANRAAEAGPPG